MKQLANVNTQEIAEVEFVFENCECCTVPIECFKELSIKPLEKYHDDELGKEYQICEVNFHVVDNCQIEMDLYTHDSFTQRVAKRHDIAQIIIEHTDGSQINIYLFGMMMRNDHTGNLTHINKQSLLATKRLRLALLNQTRLIRLKRC